MPETTDKPKNKKPPTARWVNVSATGMELQVAHLAPETKYLVMRAADTMAEVLDKLHFVRATEDYWVYPTAEYSPSRFTAAIEGSFVDTEYPAGNILLDLSGVDPSDEATPLGKLAGKLRLIDSPEMRSAMISDLSEAKARIGRESAVETELSKLIRQSLGTLEKARTGYRDILPLIADRAKIPENAVIRELARELGRNSRKSNPDEMRLMTDIAKALGKRREVVVAPLNGKVAVISTYRIMGASPDIRIGLFDVSADFARRSVEGLEAESVIFADPPPLMVATEYGASADHNIAPALVAFWQCGDGSVFDDIGMCIGQDDLGAVATAVSAELTAVKGEAVEVDNVYATEDEVLAWAGNMVSTGDPTMIAIGRQLPKTVRHFQGSARRRDEPKVPKM